jgi:hypothetical protein
MTVLLCDEISIRINRLSMLDVFTPGRSSRGLLDRCSTRVRAHRIDGQRPQNCTDLTALQDSAEK